MLMVIREPTSYPSVTERINCVPVIANCSPAAKAAGTTETPGCEREGPCESAVSSECASTPLANRAAHNVRGYDGGDLSAAIAAGKLDGSAPRRQAGAGNHRCERVQDVFFGFFGDVIRQRASAGRSHVSAELLHDGANALRSLVRI